MPSQSIVDQIKDLQTRLEALSTRVEQQKTNIILAANETMARLAALEAEAHEIGMYLVIPTDGSSVTLAPLPRPGAKDNTPIANASVVNTTTADASAQPELNFSNENTKAQTNTQKQGSAWRMSRRSLLNAINELRIQGKEKVTIRQIADQLNTPLDSNLKSHIYENTPELHGQYRQYHSLTMCLNAAVKKDLAVCHGSRGPFPRFYSITTAGVRMLKNDQMRGSSNGSKPVPNAKYKVLRALSLGAPDVETIARKVYGHASQETRSRASSLLRNLRANKLVESKVLNGASTLAWVLTDAGRARARG